MENMREYWAREAEMMRDKSGVLGTNSLFNVPKKNNNDDTPKGSISFANEFYQGTGAQILKIANLTPLYQEYLTELSKQSEYDTHVISFPSMIAYAAGPASVVNFDDNGYSEGVGTKGRTFLITDETNFKSQRSPSSDTYNYYILGFAKLELMKPSFMAKKKIILIAIASQYLNPGDYPLHTTYYTQLKTDTSSEKYNIWWDTAKLDGTHTLIHELIAHGINYIKKKKKSSKEEHFDYHGVETESSPKVDDVLANEKKYKNTVMFKAVKQIQLVIQQLYHGKK